MSLYREHVLPWLIDLSMRQSRLAPYRRRVVSAASGRVPEIGMGSGLNLPGVSRSRMYDEIRFRERSGRSLVLPRGPRSPSQVLVF
jgi:hypothetical protein